MTLPVCQLEAMHATRIDTTVDLLQVRGQHLFAFHPNQKKE
jgi:hypothetical protein